MKSNERSSSRDEDRGRGGEEEYSVVEVVVDVQDVVLGQLRDVLVPRQRLPQLDTVPQINERAHTLAQSAAWDRSTVDSVARKRCALAVAGLHRRHWQPTGAIKHSQRQRQVKALGLLGQGYERGLTEIVRETVAMANKPCLLYTSPSPRDRG
eukprot:859193-Rhodomonas_salina.2